MNSITGTLPISHNVDLNGSLSLTIPLQVPPSNLSPILSVDYHSAAKDVGFVGIGWVIKGFSLIERVPATLSQDGFRGSVNYDKKDRFALNGQRLVKIADNEYRYEIEQWSKIVATGDEANPDSFTEYLPDGTVRSYGTTSDSNIKAQGQSNKTRVWALSQHADAFTNSISYNYTNDTTNGAFYPSEIHYGGNAKLQIDHQRHVTFSYEDRPDVRTSYLGGYKIHINRRLHSISASIGNDKAFYAYTLGYDDDHGKPLPPKSRLRTLNLSDAFGAVLSPLTFDWNIEKPSVFDPLKEVATLKTGITTSEIMVFDVTASGRSDFVLYSKQQDDTIKGDGLHLAVHLADDQGSLNPVPRSTGLTGLCYPNELLSIDINGDGRSDLLHIATRDNDEGKCVHDITAIISTPCDGYQSHKISTFKLESSCGRFYTGDFNGDGNIGLLYVYEISEGDSSRIRYVQFVPELVHDEFKFKNLPALDGPLGVSLNELQVVIADLNGDGTEDVLLISPTDNKSGNKTICNFKLLRSDENGVLCYCRDDPLKDVGEELPWDSCTFIPYSADHDSKTGLLAISPDDNYFLQFRIIRSTGPSLSVPSSPTKTKIQYNGNIHLVKALSTDTVDLLNVYKADEGGFTLDILHFHNDSLLAIEGVQQPTGATIGSTVMTADIRGIGRADCIFSTTNDDGDIIIHSLAHSDTQPIDFVCGFTNGLGATVSVKYAPLTDQSVYTAEEDASKSVTSAMNAMARNVSSHVSLSSGGAVASQSLRRGRSQLVHFPAFVVQQLSSCASPSSYPDVLDQSDFTYKNARIDHGGRGWLGFETISQTIRSRGCVESTSYIQQFPLIGQTSKVQTTDLENGQLIRVNTFDWNTVAASIQNNIYPHIRGLRESYFEGGAPTYDVDVSFDYDDFGNATKITTSAPKLGKPTLSVQTVYENDTDPWVIGKKTQVTVDPGDGAVRKNIIDYVHGTRLVSKTSTWVDDSTWSTQVCEFDEAGNETTVSGPGQSLRTVLYDKTYSFPASISLFTDSNTSLTETATYELATGLPLSTIDPNGHITNHKYDVLGRLTELSEGEDSATMIVMEKRTYNSDDHSPYIYTREIRNDTKTENWISSVSRCDGLGRVTRDETNKPDDPFVVIYSDIEYDGAGRVVKRSRSRTLGQTQAFTSYTYDALSRPLTIISPAAIAESPHITTIYGYGFEGQRATMTETRSGGGRGESQVMLREYEFFLNPDPQANRYIRAFMVNSVNELRQGVEMCFDGLGRPVSVKDPTGVNLTVKWDGLSRQVERQISNPDGKQPALISHFSTEYNDDLSQISVRNVLANTITTTKHDFLQRPIAKITSDEELTYIYDIGGTNVKHRLASVKSSKGPKHRFDYDTRGNLSTFILSLDGYDYTTSYGWTASKQLLSTTNPNGSVIKRTFLATSDAVKKIELEDAQNTVQASINFSHFDNAFLRPLVCDFKNGLTSKTAVAENGVPTRIALSKGEAVLHTQEWKLDGFSRIEGYTAGNDTPLMSTYNYDKTGRLIQSTPLRIGLDGSSSAESYPEVFQYDDSGNITGKDDKTFVHNGWQITNTVSEDNNPHSSFEYSPDGNLTAKVYEYGRRKNMKYNGDGRLSDVDGTSFTYDFSGRLLKAVRSNGDITIYPNPSYEIHISTGKVSQTAYIIEGSRRASYTTTETKDNEGSEKGEGSKSYVHYYLTNHLGSTIAVSDDYGKFIAEYEYDSFGYSTLISGDDVARYKYAGKELFEGFHYFGARFYDSEIGRFLTLDDYPINLSHISPSTFNQYAFSQNDPINFFDVNGNAPWWHWFVDAGLAIGGVALMFVSGGTASVVSGMMLGAAINGFASDIAGDDDKEWGTQLGIGALTGLVTGGVGMGLNSVKALSVVGKIGTAAATNSLKAAAVVAVKVATKVAIRTAVGTGMGVVSQVVKNKVEGKPLDTDLDKAAAKAAFASFISAGQAESKGVTIARLKGNNSTEGVSSPATGNLTRQTSQASNSPTPTPGSSSSPVTIPGSSTTTSKSPIPNSNGSSSWSSWYGSIPHSA